MNAVDRTKSGAAAGVVSMSRMVGGTVGLAVMGALVTTIGALKARLEPPAAPRVRPRQAGQRARLRRSAQRPCLPARSPRPARRVRVRARRRTPARSYRASASRSPKSFSIALAASSHAQPATVSTVVPLLDLAAAAPRENVAVRLLRWWSCGQTQDDRRACARGASHGRSNFVQLQAPLYLGPVSRSRAASALASPRVCTSSFRRIADT